MRPVSLTLLLFVAISASVLAGGTGESLEIGDPAASRQVVIAAESTPFKEALVEEIVSLLDDGDTYVRVVDHKAGDLEGLDPREYDAVLITNSGARAQVRPWVIDWLESVSAYDDNVIVHTTQINEWTPKVEVDSVTSASAMGRVSMIAEDLVGRVRRMYGG